MDPDVCVVVGANPALASNPRQAAGLCKFRSRRWGPVDDDDDDKGGDDKLDRDHRRASSSGGASDAKQKPLRTLTSARGLVPADFDDDDHDAGGHRKPWHRSPFYKPPQMRFRKNAPRVAKHVGSDSLYFDLIFVGVSFRAGSILAETISGENVYIFLSTVLVLYSGWFSRLTFETMLTFEDNFHKFNFVLQGMLLALGAHQLTTFDDLADYSTGQALGFAACIALNHVFQLSVWLEVYFLEKSEVRARRYAQVAAAVEVVPLLCMMASIWMIRVDVSLFGVAGMWLCSYVLSRGCWMVLVASNMMKNRAMPWDVSYAITRFGQYTMLMLGEGVLQIIIFSALEDLEFFKLRGSYVGLFLLSYLLLGLLQLLHYSTLPFRPEDHVMLRNKAVAAVWVELFALYSCAQLSVGVALKKLIYIDFKLYKDPEKYGPKKYIYYWFFAASVCIVVFLLAAQQLSHLDLEEELGITWFKGTRARKVGAFHHHEKKRVWLVRFFVFPFVFLALAAMDTLPVYVVLVAVLLLTALFCFQIVTGRFKRKRKMNRTVAAIIAFGKLKRLVARMREEKAAAALEASLNAAAVAIAAVEDASSTASDQTIEDSEPAAVTVPGGDVTKPPSLVSPDVKEHTLARLPSSLDRALGCDEGHAPVGGESDMAVVRTSDRQLLDPQDGSTVQAPAGVWSDAALRIDSLSSSQQGTRSRTSSVSSKSSTGSQRLRKLSETGSQFMRAAKAATGIQSASKYPKAPLSPWRRFWRDTRLLVRDTNFYRAPEPKLQWDDLHKLTDEVNWPDIFFDLTFVGVAFRLNDIDVTSLEALNPAVVWYFFGEFVTLYSCWIGKTLLQAQFVSPDVFHVVLSILQFSLVAFMSSEIVVNAEGFSDEDYLGHVYAFISARLLFEVILLLQAVEILHHYRDVRAPQAEGRRMILRSSLTILLCTGALIGASQGLSFGWIIFLLAMGYFSNLGSMFVLFLLGKITNENSVPFDLHYLQHRFSELAIIMIGEGVLSIILATIRQTVEHYTTFCIGYLVLSSVRMVYFYVTRFDPAELAARKSRVLGLLAAISQPFLFAGLSAIGGLAVWTLVEEPDRDLANNKEYLYHALPFMATVCVLWVQDLLNEGPDECKFSTSRDVQLRMLVYVAKTWTLVQFPLIIFAGWPSWAGLFADWVALLIVFFSHVIHVKSRELNRQGLLRQESDEDERSATDFLRPGTPLSTSKFLDGVGDLGDLHGKNDLASPRGSSPKSATVGATPLLPPTTLAQV
ncbi:Uncharacterized protein SCF082_LOCUS7429 [Durusdinium trenchii]|uniref:Uncharacterized protein n=1 Tax=Durusdinium trenchii TaxID=1381693 RepID=A0ABP0IJ54_9DINO